MDNGETPADSAPTDVELYEFGQSKNLSEEKAGQYREAANLMAGDINGVLRDVLPGYTVDSSGLAESEPGSALIEDESSYDIAPLLSQFAPCGILGVELTLGLAVVGGALGGSTKGSIEARPMSSVEIRVLDLVMSAVVKAASQTLLIDDVSIGRSRDNGFETGEEDNPEARIGFSFEMSGPRGQGSFMLGFDEAALQRFSDAIDRRLSGRRQAPAQKQPSPDIANALRPVPVELSVGVGRARLTAREVVELRQGDVIRTRVPVSADLIASAGDTDLFEVRLGQQGTRLVAEILSTISSESSP